MDRFMILSLRQNPCKHLVYRGFFFKGNDQKKVTRYSTLKKRLRFLFFINNEVFYLSLNLHPKQEYFRVGLLPEREYLIFTRGYLFLILNTGLSFVFFLEYALKDNLY